VHPGLPGIAIPLSAIATNAGSHDVFPRRFSAAISGHYVIHVQFLCDKRIAAVLATMPIAVEQILTIELHFPQQHSIIVPEKKHTRHSHRLTHSMYQAATFRRWRLCGKSKPRISIKKTKASVLGIDDLGMLKRKQTERSFHTHHVHRLPQSIQYKRLVCGIH